VTALRGAPRGEHTHAQFRTDPLLFILQAEDRRGRLKDFSALQRLLSKKGRIRSRRITGTCPRHQTQVAVAVKRAREMALLPNASR
jgi:ribosomal protein S18